MVEHDLAKVGVAGSSPVFRSEISICEDGFFFVYPGGGTGRHAGLKILFPATGVTVQFRSRVQIHLLSNESCFFLFYKVLCGVHEISWQVKLQKKSQILFQENWLFLSFLKYIPQLFSK